MVEYQKYYQILRDSRNSSSSKWQKFFALRLFPSYLNALRMKRKMKNGKKKNDLYKLPLVSDASSYIYSQDLCSVWNPCGSWWGMDCGRWATRRPASRRPGAGDSDNVASRVNKHNSIAFRLRTCSSTLAGLLLVSKRLDVLDVHDNRVITSNFPHST